jgi:predicted dehydrogenase
MSIRIAICGLGNIGWVHLRNLASMPALFRIGWVFDIHADRCRDAASRYGAAAAESYNAILGDPSVDAVVIATPSDAHREMVLRALESGKHVFVEKPLAGTLADARAIANAAARSDRCVHVGFCERFNIHYIEAQRSVVEGRLGAVRCVHTARIAPYEFSDPRWQLGVLDTAVHNLDLITWLTGKHPCAVQAFGARVYADSDIPHAVTTVLRYSDQSLAVDHIAWIKDAAHPLHQCARSRMTLQGDLGYLELDLAQRPVRIVTDARYYSPDTVIIGAPEYYACLKLQFEAFFRSISSGVAAGPTAGEAVEVEELAVAAQESLRTGREVSLTGSHELA